MKDLAAAQSELQCSDCAGQCVYDPAQQALVCPQYATCHGLETDTDNEASRDFDFHPAASDIELPEVTETRVHHCQTCGGDVVFCVPNPFRTPCLL